MNNGASDDALSAAIPEIDEAAETEADSFFADEDQPLQPPDVFTSIHR